MLKIKSDFYIQIFNNNAHMQLREQRNILKHCTLQNLPE